MSYLRQGRYQFNINSMIAELQRDGKKRNKGLLIKTLLTPLVCKMKGQQKAVTVTKEEQAGFVIRGFLLP